MARLKLSPPWDEYYRKINALFAPDPDVRVLYDDEDYVIKLFVDNSEKATAIQNLLPETVPMGNITLKIEVIPANGFGIEIEHIEDILRIAFNGNPIVDDIVATSGMGSFNAIYVVFKKKVVQYFNDNLTDINGFRSTLYEDIAREVFDLGTGVYFCTTHTV